MEVREIFRSFSGRHDLKTTSTRPVNLFNNQRRLIAISETVHDSRSSRFLCEERSCERIGLHIDHHDVPAFAYGGTSVPEAGRRVAGCFNDDIDVEAVDGVDRVVAEAGRRYARFFPANLSAGGLGAVRGQIANDPDFQSRRMRNL